MNVGKQSQALTLLLVFNVEAVVITFGAWWIGDWLDKKFPISVSWWVVTFGLGLLTLLHSLARIIKFIKQKTN